MAKVPREIFPSLQSLCTVEPRFVKISEVKKLLRSITTTLCGACEKPRKSDLNLTVSWGTNKAWKKYDYSSEGPFKIPFFGKTGGGGRKISYIIPDFNSPFFSGGRESEIETDRQRERERDRRRNKTEFE